MDQFGRQQRKTQPLVDGHVVRLCNPSRAAISVKPPNHLPPYAVVDAKLGVDVDRQVRPDERADGDQSRAAGFG